MNTAEISEFFKRLVTGIVLLICFGGAYLHSLTLYSAFLITVLILILTHEWPHLVIRERHWYYGITLIYPVMPVMLLLWLTVKFYYVDFYLPLYPFFIAWTADTCGYLVGKLIGDHKMCPTVSPGKSWEGLFGSFIGVCIAHLWLTPRTKFLASSIIANNTITLVLFSATMTLIAFLGGFFLSYLKRKNNLKDAGTLLPGHGGLLDRFDAVFFVTYAIVIVILFS